MNNVYVIFSSSCRSISVNIYTSIPWAMCTFIFLSCYLAIYLQVYFINDVYSNFPIILSRYICIGRFDSDVYIMYSSSCRSISVHIYRSIPCVMYAFSLSFDLGVYLQIYFINDVCLLLPVVLSRYIFIGRFHKICTEIERQEDEYFIYTLFME